MATKVVVISICDICGTESEDGIQHVEIVIGKVRHEIDLCDQCYSDIPMFEFMRKVKVEKPPKEPLTKNAERVIETFNGRPLIVPCPVKGCDYMGADNRAVGIHKRRAHGIAGESR